MKSSDIQVRDVHRQKMPRHGWTNDESHFPTHCTDDVRWFHCQQILQTNTPNFIWMRWAAIHLPSSNAFAEPIFWMPPMTQWLSFEPKFVWKDQKIFLCAHPCYGDEINQVKHNIHSNLVSIKQLLLLDTYLWILCNLLFATKTLCYVVHAIQPTAELLL